MRFDKIIFALISLFTISCLDINSKKDVDNGSNEKEIFKSQEIGWSIEIPKGWTIVSKEKMNSIQQKGKEAIEKQTGEEIDTESMKPLINFKKDQFNIFESMLEPAEGESAEEYLGNNRIINQLIFKTLIGRGIKVDSSSGKDFIQDLEFDTFHTTIYAPNGSVVLNQIYYNKLIKGYSLGIIINFNNEKDKNILVKALKESKFQ